MLREVMFLPDSKTTIFRAKSDEIQKQKMDIWIRGVKYDFVSGILQKGKIVPYYGCALLGLEFCTEFRERKSETHIHSYP